MNISDQKREILNLIAKLHRPSGAEPRQLYARNREPQLAAALLQDHLLKRRRDLAEITGRREQTAADLLEERLLKICQDLDARITRIEKLIAEQSRAGPEGDPAGVGIRLNPAETSRSADGDRLGPGHIRSLPGSASAGDHGDADLGGVINRATLPDILQMISSNAMNGVFVLEGAGKRISLYMQDGEMFHAVTDDMVGQTAFFAAMAMEKGRFYFRETDDLPDERTIDGNTQFLILEALRQIDEDQQGES